MIAREPEGNNGPSRSAVRLGDDVERSLSAYAATAVAAGVSWLALASAAQAKIVYTPADVSIPPNGEPVLLDLNHDGTTDFSFVNYSTTWARSGFFILQARAASQSNAVWGRGTEFAFRGRKNVFASVLNAGRVVGPNDSYVQKGGPWLMAMERHEAPCDSCYPGTITYGQWLYTQHKYLGLKFMISGQVHYGWARFDVTAPEGLRGIQATLTGYAYETIPNKPIMTGKTKGPDVVVVVFEPASLGRLAQGTSGISAWRK